MQLCLYYVKQEHLGSNLHRDASASEDLQKNIRQLPLYEQDVSAYTFVQQD